MGLGITGSFGEDPRELELFPLLGRVSCGCGFCFNEFEEFRTPNMKKKLGSLHATYCNESMNPIYSHFNRLDSTSNLYKAFMASRITFLRSARAGTRGR